jgi:two-component system NtrC family response regulator
MKHKILIVDDEENVLFVVKAALAQHYEVLTAREGISALELISKERPVFVFLDIKMPGMSGIEVLELIKDTGATPVVWMLTGDEDLSTALRTLETGASGYLTKPFDIQRLREIVLSAVEGAENKTRRGGPSEKPWHVKKDK